MKMYSPQDKEIRIYFDALYEIRNEILSGNQSIVAISGRACKEILLVPFGAFVDWTSLHLCRNAILFFPTVQHAWDTLEEWESFHNCQMVNEKETAKRKFRIENTWFYIHSSRTKVSKEAENISGLFIYDIPRDSPSNSKIARIYASIDKEALHKVVNAGSLGWATYSTHKDIIAKKSLLIITSRFLNLGDPQYLWMFSDEIPSTKDVNEFLFNLRQEASKWRGYHTKDSPEIFRFNCPTHEMYWRSYSR